MYLGNQMKREKKRKKKEWNEIKYFFFDVLK